MREFCDHLDPAGFLKDGEHAYQRIYSIGSCVGTGARYLTRQMEFIFLGLLGVNEGVTRAAFEKSFGGPLETLRKLKEQRICGMDFLAGFTDRQGEADCIVSNSGTVFKLLKNNSSWVFLTKEADVSFAVQQKD